MRISRPVAAPFVVALAMAVPAGDGWSAPGPLPQAAAKTAAQMRAEGFRRYGVEAGVVEYSVTGPQTGTETIYFDQWGLREAQHTRTELPMMGVRQKTNTMMLIDGETTTNVNLDTKRGTRMRNNLMADFGNRSADRHLDEVGLDMLQRMGAQQAGTETIAGKTCTVWEIKSMQSRTCVWRGVVLKNQAGLGGMQIVKTVMRFVEGAPAANSFVLPVGVTYSEHQDPRKALQDLRKRQQPPPLGL